MKYLVSVAEWLARQACQAGGLWFKSGFKSSIIPLLKHACRAAMLAIYTSKGVAPEVNLRECISCTPPQSLNKAAHSGFETQRRCHQKSETGVSVAPKMDMCPTKIFLKKVSCFFIHHLNDD